VLETWLAVGRVKLSLGNFSGLNRIVNYKNCIHTDRVDKF